MKAAALIFAFVMIMWCAIIAIKKPRAQEARQWQRLEYLELRICTRGKPPEIIAQGLNAGLAKEPERWQAAVDWWNRTVEDYKKAGCGDA